MKIPELKKRLKELEFELPKDYFFEEKRNGIRVAAKTLMNVKVKGSRGIIAYNGEITHGFVLTFGKYSSKRLELSDEQFFFCAEGKEFSTAKRDGSYIAFYSNFPVCLVEVKKGKAKPFVGKGFKRQVKTKLKQRD